MEMTVEDAIGAYRDLENYMPQRGGEVTDEARLKNTEKFKSGFETVLRNVGWDPSELMQRPMEDERPCGT
jgi:hypothetical protein